MHDLANSLQEILAESREDYVGLWKIIRKVQAVGITEESKVMDATLTLVMQLLSHEKTDAGQFHNRRFEVWDVSPEEIITRIKHEWLDLGRVPNIGDIVWFTAKTSSS